MHILSILFFCMASSSDNFAIGLSYGAKAIRINFWSNLVVAFISCVGTFCAMLFGKGINRLIPANHSAVLGSALMIGFGLYMLAASLRKEKEEVKVDSSSNDTGTDYYYDLLEHPEIIDKDKSNNIDLKEAAALGLILCLNNIGLGIGASISGMNIYITSMLALIFSMIFVKLGWRIGRKMIYGRLSKYSEYVSALIIIVLGIYELFV